ncbi:MAG TPA: protein kinase, partial [Polyangiaceae bacterium]|nr:protein kinase [Polyangiaceae bacterium]
TLVLGLDGIARVLHAVSRRAVSVEPDPASLGYLAPEVASGDPYDARADVFSVGVLLWEVLSEKRLLPGADLAENVKRVRAGSLPAATVPEKAAWAKGLVDVAAKALAASPDARWPTAAVMAAELRKAAGLKLAPASTAAAFARSGFGERVRARREALEGGSSPGRAPEPVVASPPAPPAAKPQASPPAAPVAPAVKPAAPPARPAAPPESSFLEVELESAIDTVLVAPGLRAPVTEVIELGSELLLDAASNSSIPPAASSSLGGFVRDPFAAPGALAPAPLPPEGLRFTPPPAPAVAVAPVVVLRGAAATEEPSPPSISGSPHFAAAIAAPMPPPPRAPPAAPAPMRPAPSPLFAAEAPPLEALAVDEPVVPAPSRRRKAIVLGGVAVLGVVVFALAAVRLASREPDTSTSAATKPPAASAPPPVTAALATTPPPPPSTPAPAASAAPPPASAAAPTPPPAATVAASPPAAPPVVPHAPPVAPRPTPVAAAAAPYRPPATPGPAAVKPRPKPTFDPNSL